MRKSTDGLRYPSWLTSSSPQWTVVSSARATRRPWAPTVGVVQWWKWVGLAGLAGVAATGAVVARNERQRRAYTPDDVRSRLHERLAGSAAPATGDTARPVATDGS